jgi:hypothetical protein
MWVSERASDASWRCITPIIATITAPIIAIVVFITIIAIITTITTITTIIISPFHHIAIVTNFTLSGRCERWERAIDASERCERAMHRPRAGTYPI